MKKPIKLLSIFKSNNPLEAFLQIFSPKTAINQQICPWLAPGGIAIGNNMFSFLIFCTCVSSLHHGKSSSTGNLLEREDMALPVPDYGIHSRMAAQTAAALHGRQQRPYSVAVPGFSQVGVLQNKHKNTHTHAHRHPPTHINTWHMSWAVTRNLTKICACLRKFGLSCWPEIQQWKSFSLTSCLLLYEYSEFCYVTGNALLH